MTTMKSLLSLIICITCVYPLRAQHEEREEGFRLLRAKRYEDALAAFEKYLDVLDHADDLVAFNAAVCATRVGDHATAEKYFTRSIASGYNLFSSHVGKANALKEQGKFDEMVVTLEEGMKAGTRADSLSRVKVETMYAAHFLARGRDFLREKEIAKAAECYQTLTRMEDKRWKVDGYLSLGTLYTVSGDAILEKASGDLVKKSTREAARKRAGAEFKKARAYLDRAARLSPDSSRVREALARLKEITNKSYAR